MSSVNKALQDKRLYLRKAELLHITIISREHEMKFNSPKSCLRKSEHWQYFGCWKPHNMRMFW